MESAAEHDLDTWLIRPAGDRFSQETWQPLLAKPLSFSLISDARVSQVAARAEEGTVAGRRAPHQEIVVEIPEQLGQARVRTRARDVMLGRACAQIALRQAGASSCDVDASPSRAPVWPDQWTGSLSHAAGIAWAMVARQADFASLGIDLERLLDGEALESVRSLVLTPGERQFEGGPTSDGTAWLSTLIFSAKESIFKCLSPLVRGFIDFNEMELSSVDLAAGLLRFVCLRRFSSWLDRGKQVDVRFARVGDLVLTATGWPRPPAPGMSASSLP